MLALLVTACGEPQDTRPGQPVAHRQAAFKAILNVFEPMGVMLRTDTVDARTFQALAKQLVEKRDAPWDWFGPDTNYPPSHARAEVWSAPERFAAERKAFVEASDRLVRAAEGTDRKEQAAAYEALHETCRSCHKTFKTR